LYFLKFYKSLFDSDIRETMAHNMAFKELEDQIHIAISSRQNFCYETNFNSTPLHWAEQFKRNGYEINLIYLCLNSTEEAKRRVTIRVSNGGHFVADDEIEKRYFEGYHNLNTNFKYFDHIHLFDSSYYRKKPVHVLSMQNGALAKLSHFPKYLENLIPEIAKEIRNQNF